MKSIFNSEQEANEYKGKHQLFGMVCEPIKGTRKWRLVFPIEAHVSVRSHTEAESHQKVEVHGNNC
jgi:hypothetical protein